MKKILFIFLFIITLGISGTSQEKPVFQLNHVDISIDSISLSQIVSNRFLCDSFAFIKVFTDSTGIEVLLLGKESFVHLLPGKGFFTTRIGACLLVHHSFKWQETSTLLQHLQLYTRDSLYNRPYSSPELNIDYINVYENLTNEKKLLKFIPILQNHSKKDYQSWGYSAADLEQGITQKRYMHDYIGKETEQKLFQTIVDISVAVTKNELLRMQPLLKAYGYKKTRNRFVLDGNPIINLTKMKAKTRTVILTFLLSESVERKTVIISDNATFFLNNNKATFSFRISDNYR
ncbi:hypothetical protein [Lacibacter sediminis]|uniref:Uncharacterized protein n=1 Tax=Lacibacter sediminis TaxID=2760713 RepID=A0A7G5XJW5_9BACT|nr:hypothetical protein [Lacibacter sediminis]QNA45768.1 hypothetical protein H4075_06110 [Lacibacter sediminis]